MRSSTKSGTKAVGKLVPLDETSHGGNSNALSKLRDVRTRRDLMEAVRRGNPAGTVTAPPIFWDVEGNLKTTNIDSGNVNQQVVIVEHGVNHAARLFNELKTLNDRKTKELKEKLDEMESVKSEAENLYAMSTAATEEAAYIEQLEEHADQVQTDIYRKLHTQRQYEHMLARLRRNQIKFDAHLNGMEEALSALDKEGAEMVLLRKSLDAGLAKAVNVAEDTKEMLKSSRKGREVLLAQRRNELKTANRLQEWLAQREQTKRDLAKELRGDLTRAEEYTLKTQLQGKEEETKKLQRANEESQRKVNKMEEEFQAIKQVTGGNSVEQIVGKFSEQKSNRRNLENEIKDTEKKLQVAKRNLSKVEQSFIELKGSSLGSAELNREIVNSMDHKILARRNEQKVVHASAERLESVLVGLQQGANTLLQRAAPYLDITESGGAFDMPVMDDDNKWAETMNMLGTAEHVLSKMLEVVAGGADAGIVLPPEDEEESLAGSIGTSVEAPNAEYNVRVTSLSKLRKIEHREESEVNEEVGGVAQSLGMELLMKKKDDRDGEISKSMEESEGGILTRVGVKKQSGRTYNNAVRRIENAQRQKLLADKIMGKGADGEDDEVALMKAAKLKAQRAMANRLSTFPPVATLPPGVTLRDDAMTKTQAFLTSYPDII